MKISAPWASAVMAVLLPAVTTMTILYSDVQSLKETKEDKSAVNEIRLELSNAVTKNTAVLEQLVKIMDKQEDKLHVKQTFSK